MPNADSFCIGPWTEIRIHSDGSYNYCHIAGKNPEVSENINTLKPMDFFHSTDTWAGITRKSIKSGHTVPACGKCHKSEKAGVISYRMRRNLQAAIFPGDDFAQSYHESHLVSQLDHPEIWPRFYHVSFSNLCNLGCIMCNANNSTYLASDHKKIHMIQSIPILDWTKNQGWDNFCDHLLQNPDIQCLHIMGGEPLYHKRFHDLVNLLIAHDHTDYAFTFVTNGTIFDSELNKKLKKFTSVQIEISLEGVSASNDYIRYPSDTALIKHNIEQYLKLRDENFDVVLRTVPQVLSVLDYHHLLTWCKHHQVVVDSNVLYDPDYMHLGMLPDHLKQQVRENLHPFLMPEHQSIKNINLRDSHDINRALSINADMILKQMDTQLEHVDKKWAQLIAYCDKLDQIRSKKLVTACPQLADTVAEYRNAQS